MLLQTTNRKWYMASHISDDFGWSSRSFTYCKHFQMGFFIQLCCSWQDCNWNSLWRGPFAIAELLITVCQFQMRFPEIWGSFKRSILRHVWAQWAVCLRISVVLFLCCIRSTLRQFDAPVVMRATAAWRGLELPLR